VLLHSTAVAAAKIQAMMIAQGIPVKPPPLKLDGNDEGSGGTEVCMIYNIEAHSLT
jgi:hypothetical protein